MATLSGQTEAHCSPEGTHSDPSGVDLSVAHPLEGGLVGPHREEGGQPAPSSPGSWGRGRPGWRGAEGGLLGCEWKGNLSLSWGLTLNF